MIDNVKQELLKIFVLMLVYYRVIYYVHFHLLLILDFIK